MKLSENDVFKRQIRKLIVENSIYVLGFETKIFELIQKYEQKPCTCHEKTKPVFPDRAAEDEFLYG